MFCPSCGAEIEADRRFAKLVVCRFCESAVLLDERAARVAGKMSLLAAPTGPLFVGGTGELLGRRFEVLGRVRYGYERGLWDEWYLAFEDGSTAWISEDESNFSLESHDAAETAPIEYADAYPGRNLQLGETTFHLDEKGIAICEGGEGQLPFRIVRGERVPFLDLSMGDTFATVEYDIEDAGVRVFRGRRLNIADVQMDATAAEAGAASMPVERAADADRRERMVKSGRRAKSVNCVCCGAPLRVPDEAGDSIGCEYCGTVIDLTVRHVRCGGCDANISVHGDEARSVVCSRCHRMIDLSRTTPTTIELAAKSGRPKVPLRMGQRGKIRGVDYTVVGHIRFAERDEDATYHTDEFLLFSHEAGYQWLVLENGHFSWTRELNERPLGFEPRRATAKEKLRFNGRKWRVFESGYTAVQWVEGELPWVAQIGDQNYYMDAVSPPYLLSAEWTESEMEWYEAEYLDRTEVAAAFGIEPDALPVAAGVAPHQPYRRSQFRQNAIPIMLGFFLLFGMGALWAWSQDGRKVGQVTVQPSEYRSEYITPPCRIESEDSLCEARFYSGVDNAWSYFNIAVLNSNDEVVLDFSSEISYYHGYDDGSWSEGSQHDSVPFKLKQPGDYRFLIYGQGGRGDTVDAGYGQPLTVRVYEGVVLVRYYLIMAIFCGVWVVVEWVRRASFESLRWSESDAADDDD